jgi:hypothetical protein
MGLNCVIDWEKEKRIDDDLRDGKYIFVGKSIPTVRYVGTIGDFLTERRDKEFQKILEVVSRNSVEIEVEVAKAISRTLTLKTPRKEVVKQNNVEKPLVLELPKIALDGGTAVNKLMTFHVLRRLTEENAES